MKRRTDSAPEENDEKLSPEFKRELRRRIADSKDPVRYVVFSDLSGRGRFRLWLDVSDGAYGMSLDQATLFKEKAAAQAVAESYASGRKNRLHLAKITTKNGKRRVLKYE